MLKECVRQVSCSLQTFYMTTTLVLLALGRPQLACSPKLLLYLLASSTVVINSQEELCMLAYEYRRSVKGCDS